MITAALPTMVFAIRDTGALDVLSPWLPFLAFTCEFVAVADGRRVVVRGDELTILCTNGGATYALSAADADGMRRGTLLRAWGP